MTGVQSKGRTPAVHWEYAMLPEETARCVAEARARGRRVVSVGTTTARVLEMAMARGQGTPRPFAGWTDLFILPGHRFRAVDAFITNFHLPRSTLLMLVSAFAGKPLIDRAFAAAIGERYRFYSFGDGMLLL